MIQVAKTLIYNKAGKLLVLTRSDTHPRHALHLDFPGGEVEQGETIPDSVDEFHLNVIEYLTTVS